MLLVLHPACQTCHATKTFVAGLASYSYKMAAAAAHRKRAAALVFLNLLLDEKLVENTKRKKKKTIRVTELCGY